MCVPRFCHTVSTKLLLTTTTISLENKCKSNMQINGNKYQDFQPLKPCDN